RQDRQFAESATAAGSLLLLFMIIPPRTPSSTLFPYTTLFRSLRPSAIEFKRDIPQNEPPEKAAFCVCGLAAAFAHRDACGGTESNRSQFQHSGSGFHFQNR